MKTIFLTLSSPLVFRNLFFFPASVADRLMSEAEKRDDIRIVFLLLKKDYDKYLPIFGTRLSDRIIVEPVEIYFKQNTIQKMARFFWSYFIYTETTKVLATMGMRPGEPPAGGNRFASPLKWLIAHTFGRSLFMRNTVAPFLYYLVFRDRPFSALFLKYQPDAVVISSIYDRFDSRLLPEAKRRGVKTLAMAAGWDHVDKYFLPFKADIFLAPSEQVRKAAVTHQWYHPSQISVVGYPYLDFLLSPDAKMPKEEVLALFGFPPNARYVLYVSGSAYCPDEPEVISNIVSFIERRELGENVYLVIRPYLGSRGKDKDFDMEKFDSFRGNPRVFVYDRKGWGYMEDSRQYMSVIRYASAILAVYSTVFMEAVVYDRPLVATTFDGSKRRPLYRSIRRFERFEHFQDVLRIGAIRRTHNFLELKTALAAYLENPMLDGEKREIMRREICHGPRGDASSLVVEEILGALDREQKP